MMRDMPHIEGPDGTCTDECVARHPAHASSRDEGWRPKIGDWVVYAPTHGAREDGEVVAIRNEVVLVRYRGDTVAKATYLRDLEPGVPG